MPKISQFPDAGSAQNTDRIPIVRNGGDYTVTGFNLAALASYGQSYAGTFTGTGSQTVFTLPASPGSVANLYIAINGTTKVPGTDFTWTSPVTLTFASAPANGAVILYQYRAAVPIGVAGAGGANNQLQYNNSGLLNGYTMSGDATLVPTTGVITVTKTNGTSFAASATTDATVTGNITYTNGGTGSVSRTATSKFQEWVSAKDFGAVANGVTDDTAAVQAAITSLGAGGGFVHIDRNVLYTFASLTVPQNVSLYDEANNRIVFHDVALEDGSATNLLFRSPIDGPTRMHVEPRNYPTGVAAKQDWMFDPYQSDNINYRIVNLYTKTYDASDASTTQGNNGVAVLGVKGLGNNFGIWPTLHFGFSDDGAGAAVPMKMLYFDTSDTVWRTPMTGAWRAGVAVNANDYRLASTHLYQAVGSGTTGSTVPTHTSGSVSDGGVTWTFIRDFSASSSAIKGCILFGDRDDLPKFGLSTVRAQYSQDVAFWNSKKIRFLDGSSVSAWSIYTNGATNDLYIETESAVSRLRLGGTGQFLQITSLGVASNGVTATSLSATPSIQGVRTLVFNNASATSVTSFTGGIGYQEFYVRSANGQTTLVHGTNIRLIGAVNKTLTTDDILLFQTNGAGTVATQVA